MVSFSERVQDPGGLLDGEECLQNFPEPLIALGAPVRTVYIYIYLKTQMYYRLKILFQGKNPSDNSSPKYYSKAEAVCSTGKGEQTGKGTKSSLCLWSDSSL